MTRPSVPFYLDFVSPYVYLALERAADFAEEHGVALRPRPIVYGAILGATGLVGPVEVDAKRRYTFADVVRCAAAAGVPLVGPPSHPFRSLSALRVLALHADAPTALSLARRIARAAWAEGRDVERWDVLADCVRESGLEADGLEERALDPLNKERLRAITTEALEAGVFGIPTFALDGELFWGHDRMDALGARLDGTAEPLDRELLARMLERPIGVRRA